MKKFGEGQQPFHAIIDIPEGDSQELTTVTDQAMNSFYGELFNLLYNHGINPTATTNADLKQVARAVWSAVSVGNLFKDNGTANVKSLMHIKGGGFLFKNSVLNDFGFTIKFLNKETNTGNVIINVIDIENNINHFNNIPLVYEDGTEIPVGILSANSMCEAYYNSNTNKFIVLSIGSIFDLANDNINLGDALIRVKQPFSNAVNRNQHQKNAENLTPYDFGAVGDGQTDDIQAINAVINASRNLQEIDLKGGGFYVSASPTNPHGKRFANGQIISTTPLGGRAQLNSYADDRILIGKEYAYRLFKRLEVGGALNMFLYGDSTVAMSANGGGYAGAAYEPQNLIKRYLQKIKGVRNPINITNRAIGGTSIYQMNAVPDIDTQTGSTDVLIIKYFINDRGRGLEQATADLYQKLYEIRNSSGYATVNNLTIILVMQNAVYDPQHGRTNEWDEQVRNIFVKMAREFKCVLFDTYAFLRDIDWASGFMMDDPFGNKQGIHPTAIMQNWIWAGLIDNLITQSDTAMLFPDDWVEITAKNGWVDNQGGFAPIGASMSLDGWVSLRGVLKGGAQAQNTIVATLPNGYYPLYIEHFTSASSEGMATLRINTDGNVYLAVATTFANISLSNIRFKAR